MAKLKLEEVLKETTNPTGLFKLHLKNLGFKKFEVPLIDEKNQEEDIAKCKSAWKELTSLAEKIVVVMPNGLGHKKIKSFKEFDTYVRTNDIEGEEIWFLESESSILLQKLIKATEKENRKKFS